ncbi:MAG: tetratricopeptide repeat protein [Bryobacterales bacterium]|nr:tetratricopeptide repeat protein [Bryobacterales bacterium]
MFTDELQTGLCYNFRVPGSRPKELYSREQVRRVLAVSERQLRSWERQNLITVATSFNFTELVALRTLVKLRKSRVSPLRIRRAFAALRQTLRGTENPFSEVKFFTEGKRIGVQIAGRKMEPMTGQLLFDFDADQPPALVPFSEARASKDPTSDPRLQAEAYFQRGLEVEQTGGTVTEAIEFYEKAIELDPHAAGALVNLGTIHFNSQRWKEAESFYRQAVDADPEYALAHFNLGNLYDEMGQRAKAMEHYQASLHIAPAYADAHYNVALLYQSSGELMRAAQHWRTYLKLDSGSTWASIAKRELEKLRRATLVPGCRIDSK